MPIDSNLPRLDVIVIRGHANSRGEFLLHNLCEGLTEIDGDDDTVYTPGTVLQWNDPFAKLLGRIEQFMISTRRELNQPYTAGNDDWRHVHYLIISTQEPLPVVVEEIRNLCKRFMPADQIVMTDITVKGDIGLNIAGRTLETYERYNREQLYV